MRPAPAVATWFLELFCSTAEHESVTGDLLEQYQLGRGRFWYWRQVLGIVLLGLYGKAVRRPLVPSRKLHVTRGFAWVFIVAGLSAVLVSDIWVIGVVGILGGLIAAILIFGAGLMSGLGNDRMEQTRDAHSLARIAPNMLPMLDAVPVHRGISISHIPVEGAVGLLFVLATGLIFGIGVPAIRQILLVTVPLGILGSGILFYWHKRHPRDIQALDLRIKNRARIQKQG